MAQIIDRFVVTLFIPAPFVANDFLDPANRIVGGQSRRAPR
jgi:hypothetical protein